jgi:ABC-type molybdenum transport system ATPase subunit/photorepair protein PhrA
MMNDRVDASQQLAKPFAIHLTDVTIRLGKKHVLKCINMSIEQGGM